MIHRHSSRKNLFEVTASAVADHENEYSNSGSHHPNEEKKCKSQFRPTDDIYWLFTKKKNPPSGWWRLPANDIQEINKL